MQNIHLYHCNHLENNYINILFFSSKIDDINPYQKLNTSVFYNQCSNKADCLVSYTINNYNTLVKQNNIIKEKDDLLEIQNIYFNPNRKQEINQFIKNNLPIITYTQYNNENNEFYINAGLPKNKQILYDIREINNAGSMGFGQSNDTAIFILLANLEVKNFKYLTKEQEEEQQKIKFILPNILKTAHFFTTIKINDISLQYDSNYHFDIQNTITKEEAEEGDKQILIYPLQGLNNCFFFNLFFIKNTINIIENQQLSEENLIKNLKGYKYNLKIVEDVLNFLIPLGEQTIFFSREFNKLQQYKEIYNEGLYYLTLGNISETSQDSTYYINKCSKDLTVEAYNEHINFTSFINYKGIIDYCNASQLNIYSYYEKTTQFERENPSDVINQFNSLDANLSGNTNNTISKQSSLVEPLDDNKSDELIYIYESELK